MRKLLFLFFGLFVSVQSFAQEPIEVNGIVLDVNSLPVEFANAILVKTEDSSLVKGAITDAKGSFTFENLDAGNYLVLVSQVGYSKYYSSNILLEPGSGKHSIPQVTLLENTIQLKEANVVARKPFIERRMDMTIVNVENSIVDAGATALEILKRSPGVIVDSDGNISIKGKQGVLVLIDDKPTYLSSTDLYNMLRNMTSDQLSRIEIITNPSARYDASGTSGILNIRLKKNQNLGLNGSVTASYGQGRYPDVGIGSNLNFRKEKFNAYGNFNYSYGYYFEEIELNRRFKEEDHTSTFIQESFDKGRYINSNYRAGIDYFISDKHTIGFQVKGYSSANEDRTTSTTEIYNYSSIADSGYVTQNENDSEWKNFTTNLNYRFQIDSLGRELTIDLDYGLFDNKSDFRFQTDYYFPAGTKPSYQELATNDQPATIDIRSVKMDYVHPFSKEVKFEAGLKSSFVQTDSDVRYSDIINGEAVLNTGKSNHFVYEENINAAYLSGSFERKKVGVKLGLRLEQTIAEGNQITTASTFHRDEVQLFPTAFFSYEFSDKNQSQVSYAKRIDRPGYQQLNPFRYFLDPYNYMEGNPELEPQLTNSFEVAHTYMKMFTLSLNYSHTVKAMTQISNQIDSTRTTFVRTENLDSHDNYGVSLNVPVQITKWWYSSNNFNLFNSRYQGIASVGNVDKQLTSYTFNTYNSISLPKSWSMEFNAYYNSRMVSGTVLIDPFYSISAGFRKNFMDDKFSLRVNVNDIFHTESFNSVMNYQNVDAEFHRIYDTQFVRFHVSYNFGKKSIPRAKNRATGLQEEENRINTGR
ncbi:MAG: TonB-dependent receptor [Bacteroidia bacterium]|nr:TonB-dependent receptor [Bacteroidia bacterium]